MSIEKRIKKAKSDYPNIMDQISKILSENSIVLSSQTKGEIVIKDHKKEEILDIVYSLPITADTLFILVDVVSAKNTVYIREKSN